MLRFPEEPQAAPASRHLGDLARYVAEAAQAARDHKPEEMRDPERAAKRARLFEMARAASARDHESALERKQVIERRKEEQERLMAEKKAAEVRRGVLYAIDATPYQYSTLTLRFPHRTPRKAASKPRGKKKKKHV